MSGRFDGRVAFVTGGGSGIGRATTPAFAAEGAAVAVAGLPERRSPGDRSARRSARRPG